MAAARRFGSLCRQSSLFSLFHRSTNIAPPAAVSGRRFSSSEVELDGRPVPPRPEEASLTATQVVVNNAVCRTPREANTNLLDFLNRSDMQKRHQKIEIPFFTSGSYLAVTRADPHSPTGTTKFVGICIARRNKGLGSTFILRNVISGIGVEMMFELYSPAIKEIQVLKLERRRRAKLYYLRDKPLRYSTVNEKMQPVKSSDELSVYKRKKGAPA